MYACLATLHIPFEGACSSKDLTFYNEIIIIIINKMIITKNTQKKCKQDHNEQQDHDEQQAHDIKLMTIENMKK
jgi:hypothetical protein